MYLNREEGSGKGKPFSRQFEGAFTPSLTRLHPSEGDIRAGVVFCCAALLPHRRRAWKVWAVIM